MRRWHRWFGLAAALLLGFVALTGVALQADLWLTGHPPPGADEAVPPHGTPLPDDAALSAMIARAADALRARHAGLAIERIEIGFGDGRPVVTAGAAAPFGPQVRIDPFTGADLPALPGPRGYHEILQDLHAGYRFGLIGRLLSVGCGIALVVLSATGAWVYLDMYRRRRRAGRRRLFWH